MPDHRPAERGGAPHLMWRDPTGASHVRVLWRHAAPLSIGRGPAMDIVLAADPSVSYLHAELACVSGEWLLVDDGLSRNGSYVNGERVTGRRRLRDADRVGLGHTELVFSRPSGLAQDVAITLPDELRPTHRAVLAELSRPGRVRACRLPATNTEIALALGMTIAAVRRTLTDLCRWYGIDECVPARARAELATIAASLDLGDDGPA